MFLLHDFMCSVNLGFFVVISSVFLILFFSVLVKRMAGKAISEVTYFVSSGI